MTTPAQTLSAVEATDLHELEEAIEKGLATFIEVGQALQRIRDGRLYRESHATFEEYSRDRWGLSRAHAYRQIDAAAVVNTLSPTGDTPAPASERVARELVPLKDEPEKLRETWRETVEQHGPKPTAEHVREVVATTGDPVSALSPARYGAASKLLGTLRGMVGNFGLIDDNRLSELEQVKGYDHLLRELRDGRRDLTRLIKRIEERAGVAA